MNQYSSEIEKMIPSDFFDDIEDNTKILEDALNLFGETSNKK